MWSRSLPACGLGTADCSLVQAPNSYELSQSAWVLLMLGMLVHGLPGTVCVHRQHSSLHIGSASSSGAAGGLPQQIACADRQTCTQLSCLHQDISPTVSRATAQASERAEFLWLQQGPSVLPSKLRLQVQALLQVQVHWQAARGTLDATLSHWGRLGDRLSCCSGGLSAERRSAH